VVKIERLPIGMGEAEELRAELVRLRKAGKRVAAVLLSGGDKEYLVATGADRIWVAPQSFLAINGLSASVIFLGETMEKLGIRWDVARVGAYKNLPDQLTRASMSPEQRESLDAFLDTEVRRYEGLVADSRALAPDRFRKVLEEGLLPPRLAVREKLADDLVDPAQLDRVGAALVPDGRWVGPYWPPQPERRWGEPRRIAVVPVIGSITAGRSRSDPLGFSRSAGSDTIEKALRDAAHIRGPVVVHVVTNKGQGYGPAVADKIDKFHGVSTFDPDSGAAGKKVPDWTDIFGAALCEAAESDSRIVAITAAMASSTGLLDFARRFPDRFFDVGIAEQHAVTFAAGLAMRGLRPVVCIYSTFLQRAFDQVTCDVALHRLPVTFVIDRAGITGPDGPSHHGALDLAYLRCIPGMTISAPSSPDELRRMFATALAGDGPFSIRFPRGPAPAAGTAPLAPVPVPSIEIRRRGQDLAVFAVGKMVDVAMRAQEMLAGRGISTTVVDARFVKPLDTELSAIAARHRAVITVEDGTAVGGFGTAVTELLSGDGVTVPIARIGLPDRFIEHGAQGALLGQLGLDADGIAAAALALLPAAEVLAG